VALGAGVVRPDAVLRGAATGGPLVVIAALLYELTDGGEDGDASLLTLPLTIVLLGGLVLAGFVAARHAPRAPFTNGALASLTVVIVLQVLAIAAVAVRGEDLPSAVAMLFRAFVAYGAGLFGAVASARLSSRVEEAQ